MVLDSSCLLLMRAALDVILLFIWAVLAVGAASWFLFTAYPSSNALGDHGRLCGRLLIMGFPLISAYRVQRNYDVPGVHWWAAGLLLFSLLFVTSYMGEREAVLQGALVLASVLFIALPVPMGRVWHELRKCYTGARK